MNPHTIAGSEQLRHADKHLPQARQSAAAAPEFRAGFSRMVDRDCGGIENHPIPLEKCP